jgi:signal transduction histidine kinase
MSEVWKKQYQRVPNPSREQSMVTAAQQISKRLFATPANVGVHEPLESKDFLKKIVDACAANIAIFDESGSLLYTSRAWRAFASENGFTSTKDAFGLYTLQATRDNAGADLEGGFRQNIKCIIRGERVETLEECLFNTLIEPRWFLVKTIRVDIPGGFRVLVTLEDITRRKQAEDELRSISGRLIDAHEEERTRLARELHDDLSQQLAMLAFEIDQLQPRILVDQKDLKSSVQHLRAKTQELCSEIHRLSYQLHPFKLDHLGLSEAIKSLCGEVSDYQDLKVRFQQKGFPAELPADVTLCVFRIAQESLQNIVKHSGAREAEVIVTKTTNAVRLRVSDQGCGFDIEQAKTKKRLGLLSVRERLRLVGGHVSIDSAPTLGTMIDVFIPLKPVTESTPLRRHARPKNMVALSA